MQKQIRTVHKALHQSFLCALFCVGLIPVLRGQSFSDEPIKVPILQIHGATLLPGGDFAGRFGFHANVGGGFLYKTASNWTFGIEGDFIFGPNVREDNLLDDLMTEDGFLIGLDGALYRPILYLRGLKVQAVVEKVLPFWNYNLNSGPVIRLGAGYLRHRIYYDVKQRGNLPQTQAPYIHGYDRLHAGVASTQYIGYHHMSNNRLINFSIGLEITTGYTWLQRDFQYDNGGYAAANGGQFDLMWGLRARWYLPFYKKRVVDYNKYYQDQP